MIRDRPFEYKNFINCLGFSKVNPGCLDYIRDCDYFKDQLLTKQIKNDTKNLSWQLPNFTHTTTSNSDLSTASSSSSNDVKNHTSSLNNSSEPVPSITPSQLFTTKLKNTDYTKSFLHFNPETDKIVELESEVEIGMVNNEDSLVTSLNPKDFNEKWAIYESMKNDDILSDLAYAFGGFEM